MKRNPKRTYRILRQWSVRKAEYVYVAYQDTHWEDEVNTSSVVGTGDREWAETNAKHLDIEIQDAKTPVFEVPLWLGML